MALAFLDWALSFQSQPLLVMLHPEETCSPGHPSSLQASQVPTAVPKYRVSLQWPTQHFSRLDLRLER